MTTADGKKLSRRGLVQYAANPFIASVASNERRGIRKISDKSGNRLMVMNEGTGEQIGPAGFYHVQEIDRTQFVKLYVDGVKAFKGLSSAGAKVFEFLYLQVQQGIGRDVLFMSYPEVDQLICPMSLATFMRGMRDLLANGFIAESTTPNKYFLNPDYLWNGDRLAFVREYRQGNQSERKSSLSYEDKKLLGG